MHHIKLLALLAIVTPVLAQNVYVPDNGAATGNSNVIPFGHSYPNGPFSNCHMQLRVTAAELGGVANLITGLGFACSGSGPVHHNTLEIVIDHIPAAQAFSTTFASNLTVNAVTVLSDTDYTWIVTANTWIEVGLNDLFVFNGIDDVVIDITTIGSTAPAGMRNGTNERIFSWTQGALSGYSDLLATKIEVSMEMGRTSSHGVGCAGSNGTPSHSLTGTGQVGTTVSMDVSNGLQSGMAMLIAGPANLASFPLDLGFLNMPGCLIYTDLTLTIAVPLDATGSASYAIPLPTAAFGFKFYSQYACFDPAANLFGFTSSNYARTYLGN